MALARQRVEWQRAAVMTAATINHNAWRAGNADPEGLIPAEFRPPKEAGPEPTDEEREQAAALGWRLMDRAFGGKR